MQVSGFKFFQVLPYIPPLNTDFLHKKLVNALQNKRVYLAGLANAEQECNELVKVLCPLLGDAEIVTTVTPDQPCTTPSDHVQRIYRLFHCMYLCFPIASIFFVSPPIGERFVRSVFPYDYLICFRLRSQLLSVPVSLYLLIRYASGNRP